MSAIDLTPIVEAAAAAAWQDGAAELAPEWDVAPPLVKYEVRESVLPVVTAAVDAAIPVLLAPIRQLHRERTERALSDAYCIHEECDHDGDCPTVGVGVCTECWDVCEQSNRYFAEQGIPEGVLWPCGTARTCDLIEGKNQ